MDNKDLLNAATGYAAGNALARSIANSLREQREEIEKRLAHTTTEEVLSAEIAKFLLNEERDGAYEYLNARFNEEIIGAAQNQASHIYSLETILKKRKEKYNPFYERIGMQMPENLASITADKLCRILGVENLHIIDSTDGKRSPSHASDSGCLIAATIGAIILFGFIIHIIIALAITHT